MANYETLVKFKYLFDSDRRLKKMYKIKTLAWFLISTKMKFFEIYAGLIC